MDNREYPKMKHQASKWWVEYICTFFIMGVVLTSMQYGLKFGWPLSIIIAVILSISFLSITINYKVFRIHDDVKELSSAYYGIKFPKIQEIAKNLEAIEHSCSDKDDLFERWYDKKLDELLEHTKRTAGTESYTFDTSLIREQGEIFKIFHGSESDYHWATSSCKGIDWFLTTEGESFIRQLYKTYKEGKIRSLRRLFIYDSMDELADLKVELCLYLHETSNYEYEIISRDEFKSIWVDFRDQTLSLDFGLHGSYFVWETPPKDPVIDKHGEVCANKKRINTYTQLYKTLWAQAYDYRIENQDIRENYKDYRIDDFRQLYKSYLSS